MANIIQKKRLTNEVKLLTTQPLHYCTAYPDENNPLIWYFLIVGQKDTDYYKGEYIGKIHHSKKYPAEPPDYYMLTPSGRFKVGDKICLTNSGFHKGDWSSTWNILSILIAFNSIWLDDSEHGISHIKDSSANRKKLAKESISYNIKNNSEIYNKFNREHLRDEPPEIVQNIEDNNDEKQDLENIKDNNNDIKNNDIKNNDIKNNDINNNIDIEEKNNVIVNKIIGDDLEKQEKIINDIDKIIDIQEKEIKSKMNKINKK